jgi:excisionase family DNA binding protein
MSETHIPADRLPTLTVEDIAARLGCTVWWVKKQCRAGQFPHFRIGGAIRFSEDQFAEIMRGLEQRPL